MQPLPAAAGPTFMRSLWTFVAVLLTGALAACGGGGTPAGPATSAAAPPASPSPDPLCFDTSGAAHAVAIPGTGAGTLSGYVVGDGATGVVVANQASSTMCGWLPFAKALAAKGFRVLAFDFNGEGGSTRSGAPGSVDVAAAAAFLKTRPGVSKLLLIGASRGGTATLVAAKGVRPAAVISLSSPAAYAGDDAAAAVPALAMPTLFVASLGDSTFAADARTMSASMRPKLATLTIVPGRAHGMEFVSTAVEGADQAMAAVTAVLAAR
jgi:pimeloyl-ACP methyl ester carboxylesterase